LKNVNSQIETKHTRAP